MLRSEIYSKIYFFPLLFSHISTKNKFWVICSQILIFVIYISDTITAVLNTITADISYIHIQFRFEYLNNECLHCFLFVYMLRHTDLTIKFYNWLYCLQYNIIELFDVLRHKSWNSRNLIVGIHYSYLCSAERNLLVISRLHL